MRRVTLRWPLAGIGLGVLGYLVLVFGIGAILNGADITNTLTYTLSAFCPASLVHGIRNGWAVLALNCAIYASLITVLRFAWIRLRN